MFNEHPSFIPIDSAQRVWRYLDFTKFVSLLDSSSLWFTKPRMFRDPWELALTRRNLNRLAPGLQDQAAITGMLAVLDSFFVNCWHINDIESAAMWDLYLSSGEGVAVQSTWRKLTAGFMPDQPTVFGGAVRYLDYEEDDTWDESNMFFPVGTKRLGFQHEREARLVVWALEPGTQAMRLDPHVSGIMIPIDLEAVVERIVVAPGSQAWFKDLVRRVADVLEFECPIEDSVMDAEPISLATLLAQGVMDPDAVTQGQTTQADPTPQPEGDDPPARKR